MKNIDIFPWNDHFNTGIEVVDIQHRQLVVLLNRLATLVTDQSNNNELNAIFDELAEYTIYHFQTEETIWNQYLEEDSLASEHQAVHQKFIDTILRLKEEQEIKPLSELIEEAFGFLVRWLTSHILESDRHIAYVVLSLKTGLDLEAAKTYAKEQMSGSNHALIEIILSIYATLSNNMVRLKRELHIHALFEQTISYEEHYRKLLLELSTSFINLPLDQIDTAIESALEKMANFVSADRVYIFDYDFDTHTTSNTYEWCAKGIAPQIQELQNLPLGLIADWPQRHARGEYVLIPDVFEMPEGELRDILLPQEIQSLITFPIFENGSCAGFVGFDAVKQKHSFSDTEIALLKLFSSLLGNISDRKNTETTLANERGFLKTLIQAIPDLIWMKDPDGVYLVCNERFEAFFGAKEADIFGKTDYDFVEKSLADFFRMHDKTVMQNNKPNINEEEIPFASDGHKEILQTTKVPVHDVDGNILGVLGVARNITELKEVQRELILERNRFEKYLQTVEAIIVSMDAKGNIILVNRKGCDLLEYTQEELIGQQWFKHCLPQPEGMEQVYPIFLQIMAGHMEGSEYFENLIKTKSGKERLIAWHNTYLIDENGVIIGTLSAGEDITQKTKAKEHLEYIAHYDALTGLPNRLMNTDRLRQAMLQSRRRNEQIAILYLDLDGFKEINDTHGHHIGDKLLIALSSRMKNALRDGDTIARLGGDEFVVILIDLDEPSSAFPVIQRLLDAASQATQLDEIVVQVSASIGVAFYDQDDTVDADQLIRQADQAMYEAKQSGKNRYHIFNPEHDRTIRVRHENLDRIRLALDNHELVLYYQPKINMRTNELIGAEALIRWQHPQKGIIPPLEFIPIIENHPLAVNVGEWVVNEAISQIIQWQKMGLNLPVSVNIGARQLLQEDFIERLRTILGEHEHFDSSLLEIEILETSALENVDKASAVIEECKRMGINFALDDFGTGYSSLTYLKQLPIKTLKIDQSFVRDMLDDSDDLAILEGIVGLAKAFGREVIAEGVETHLHGQHLLTLGCKRAQGYGIARPMPPEQMIEWAQQWQRNHEWKH